LPRVDETTSFVMLNETVLCSSLKAIY